MHLYITLLVIITVIAFGVYFLFPKSQKKTSFCFPTSPGSYWKYKDNDEDVFHFHKITSNYFYDNKDYIKFELRSNYKENLEKYGDKEESYSYTGSETYFIKDNIFYIEQWEINSSKEANDPEIINFMPPIKYFDIPPKEGSVYITETEKFSVNVKTSVETMNFLNQRKKVFKITLSSEDYGGSRTIYLADGIGIIKITYISPNDGKECKRELIEYFIKA